MEKEAEMARSKHGEKRKAQQTSDESSKEDNATRKLLYLAGYDEVVVVKVREKSLCCWELCSLSVHSSISLAPPCHN